jgi:hypothetical protein
MVSCNIAFLRFLHFKGGVMITKTFAINYLHLYGVFCNACNRQTTLRMDRHETIVAERCETFRYYCIVGVLG